MNNLFEILIKAELVDDDTRQLDGFRLEGITDNWTEVKSEDLPSEDLSVENFEVISLDEKQLVIYAGGDWQKPMKVIFVATPHGTLNVTHEEPVKEWKKGLSAEEVEKILLN